MEDMIILKKSGPFVCGYYGLILNNSNSNNNWVEDAFSQKI